MTQNAECESIIGVWAGSEFQAAGPVTVILNGLIAFA